MVSMLGLFAINCSPTRALTLGAALWALALLRFAPNPAGFKFGVINQLKKTALSDGLF